MNADLQPRKLTLAEHEQPRQVEGLFKVFTVPRGTWSREAVKLGRRIGLKPQDAFPVRALMKQWGIDVAPTVDVLVDGSSDTVVVMSRI